MILTMDEADKPVVGLYEKMCHMFPDLPLEIIRHYVTTYPGDENSCTNGLSFQQSRYQNSSPSNKEEALISQMRKLSLNKEQSPTIYGDKKTTNMNRSSNNRSISDAGLHFNVYQPQVPTVVPHTAPATSKNFYGLNYPFIYLPYGPNFVYNNNNMMPLQPMENLFLQVPVSNAGAFSPTISPRMENGNVVNELADGHQIPNAQLNTQTSLPSGNQGLLEPALPPRPNYNYRNLMQPAPGGVLLIPQVSPNAQLHPSGSPIPRNSASPQPHFPVLNSVAEDSESKSFSRPKTNTPSPHSGRTAIDAELHVNVDGNDSAPHDWLPAQMYPPAATNYPYFSPVPYNLGPNIDNQGLTLPTMPQPLDSLPPQVHMSPMYWNQPSIPLMTIPPFQYQPQAYYTMTSTDRSRQNIDIQRHYEKQKEMLNSLKYELVTTKVSIENCKEEVENLEQQLKYDPVLPNKDEIDKLDDEISKLRMECYCLCTEVDQYQGSKGRLGEINEEFYSCIDTGQKGPLVKKDALKLSRKISTTDSNRKGSKQHSKQISSEEDEENKESSKWKCPKCTFANHPAISICEICQVSRNPHYEWEKERKSKAASKR